MNLSAAVLLDAAEHPDQDGNVTVSAKLLTAAVAADAGLAQMAIAVHRHEAWHGGYDAAHVRVAPSSLDAAWAEAEAALPPDAVIRMGRSGGGQTRGWATAYLHGECIGVEFAATLPAALRALTAQLRANR